MKKPMIIVVVLLIASTAYAGRTLVKPITHAPWDVYEAYPGDSNGANAAFYGYGALAPVASGSEYPYLQPHVQDAIGSVPGVLSIIPGESWSNYVKAAQTTGVLYYIKNVYLTKQVPPLGQCQHRFAVKNITQRGSDGIRLWWPLMFEPTGVMLSDGTFSNTTWTLTVYYGTYSLWQDDPSNPPSTIHTEIWSWSMDADLASLKNLLVLFHELPFGMCEIPLISDEEVYRTLLGYAEEAMAKATTDPLGAGIAIQNLEAEIWDNIADSCMLNTPDPGGDPPYFGVVETECYPVACKLTNDAEYVAQKLGLWTPAE